MRYCLRILTSEMTYEKEKEKHGTEKYTSILFTDSSKAFKYLQHDNKSVRIQV